MENDDQIAIRQLAGIQPPKRTRRGHQRDLVGQTSRRFKALTDAKHLIGGPLTGKFDRAVIFQPDNIGPGPRTVGGIFNGDIVHPEPFVDGLCVDAAIEFPASGRRGILMHRGECGFEVL